MSRTYRRKNYPKALGVVPTEDEAQRDINRYGFYDIRHKDFTAKQVVVWRHTWFHSDCPRWKYRHGTWINAEIRAKYKASLTRQLKGDLEEAYIQHPRSKQSVCWLIE